MGTQYLIDTCAVIKYLQESFPEKGLLLLDSILDRECQISFITQIELLAWKYQQENSLLLLKQFIKGSKVLFINDAIINQSIEIRKKTNIKLPDAIIAATAICNNFTLISDNDKDFKKIIGLGLDYLNPQNF
ncbi:MAG TPA: type II toxin-antitoxin system VapC family toxin [Prolixibacteraceae bacterium]|nr:type II toxin-antitoxin system VapC family toxin [Prolixibacteraceae bacterium]HPS11941.1 type II toxin-antitoxin system VapC family toxin [Prolixibacteraceae bacterium]